MKVDKRYAFPPLMNKKACERWLADLFHPDGLRCSRCGDPVENAYPFRTTKTSELTVYRCRACGQTYNLYSGTIFEQRHLTPQQVVLLIQGLLHGEPATDIAADLEIHYNTILEIRHGLQANAIL